LTSFDNPRFEDNQMEIPLQITFRGMSPMPSIGSLIMDRAQRLQRFSDRIIRCHVVVDVPHRQHGSRRYSVHVEVSTVLGSIVATHGPVDGKSPPGLLVIVREAFDAVTRQLEDETRRRSA
jgi:ribosome-associated translation inhibitor RaiA